MDRQTPDGYADPALKERADQWREGDSPASDLVAAFVERISREISSSLVVSAELGRLLEGDLASVKGLFDRCRTPVDPFELHHRVTSARSLAFSEGPNPVNEAKVRSRWLVCGAWDLALTRFRPSNDSQVLFDILNFLGSVVIARRYNDQDRRFQLALAELILRSLASRAAGTLRHDLTRLATFIVGTYLVIAGPEPYRPSHSREHPALRLNPQAATPGPSQGAGAGTSRADVGGGSWYVNGSEDRDQWPSDLLWHGEDQRSLHDTTAFALNSLASWDADVLEVTLAVIFHRTKVGDETVRASRQFWESQCRDLLRRAARVEIADNPWDVESVRLPAAESDETMYVASGALRAVAAQLLTRQDRATVNGGPFAGRRVPSYLIKDRFGTTKGLLKIDYVDRVQWERENFDEYVEPRIHSRYRPSGCKAGDYRFFAGSAPEPVQGILTSYVFDEGETPVTMSSWLQSAPPANVGKFVENVFLKALEPWVGRPRRRTIDTRQAYPVLRPRPAHLHHSKSDRTAKTELPRLIDSQEVGGTIGFRLQTQLASGHVVYEGAPTA